MIIGSVCENKATEKRISVTPDNVKKYVSNGFKVYLEKNYGIHLDIDDEKFSEKEKSDLKKIYNEIYPEDVFQERIINFIGQIGAVKSPMVPS